MPDIGDAIPKIDDAPWPGFPADLTSLAVVGAMMLAADKGALCLTMSALSTLPDEEFALMMPGLLAMFGKEGWLVLLWGILLLPIGFAVQAIALLKTRSLPRWQAVCFLIGVLFIGTPDGVEIVNLAAAVLVAIALMPYGINMIRERGLRAGSSPQSLDGVPHPR